MSDPFQRLRWALGADHPHLKRLDDYRAQVRVLVGTNEEAKLADSIADDVDGMSPLGAAEVATDRLKAEAIGLLGAGLTEATAEVWRRFLETRPSKDRLVELERALTVVVEEFLDDRDIEDGDRWRVVVFRKGESVPIHIKLLGSRLVKAPGFDIGHHGESLMAIGRQETRGGGVVYCEMQAIPAVALGYDWDDEEPIPETLPTGQPIEVVDEAEIRAAAKAATADIDEAIAELK